MIGHAPAHVFSIYDAAACACKKASVSRWCSCALVHSNAAVDESRCHEIQRWMEREIEHHLLLVDGIRARLAAPHLAHILRCRHQLDTGQGKSE